MNPADLDGMEAMSPVPANDPLMIAWEAYKASPEYANTRRWALQEAHVDGSLWAAFVAGFSLARRAVSAPGGGEGVLLRRAVYDWLRDDVPLAAKMVVMPEHVDALQARLTALGADQ